MTTQYTPSLRLALPGTGELDGLWGQVVNDQITEMLEQAITGHVTISTWTANSHTLTTIDGTLDEARAAVLTVTVGNGNPSLPFTVIAPDEPKLYVVANTTAVVLNVTTSAPGASTFSIPPGHTVTLSCNGSQVRATDSYAVDFHVAGRSVVAGAATQSYVSVASSSTVTLNADVANFYYMPSTPGGTVTVSLSGGGVTGVTGNVNFLALLVNPGTGSISWPPSVRWPNNTAPIINSNTFNLFLFTQYTGTSFWYGAVLNNYV
jgi:hypothetical protein